MGEREKALYEALQQISKYEDAINLSPEDLGRCYDEILMIAFKAITAVPTDENGQVIERAH